MATVRYDGGMRVSAVPPTAPLATGACKAYHGGGAVLSLIIVLPLTYLQIPLLSR
jgi:hypothetical protein